MQLSSVFHHKKNKGGVIPFVLNGNMISTEDYAYPVISAVLPVLLLSMP